MMAGGYAFVAIKNNNKNAKKAPYKQNKYTHNFIHGKKNPRFFDASFL